MRAAGRNSEDIPLYFDAASICVGGSYIAPGTNLRAFVYILKAIDVPCEESGPDTVCVEHVLLLHNLHGKCYFRFKEDKDGSMLFSKVKFVLDPDYYPGLKDAPRQKQLNMFKDFVAVSLGDRLGAMSEPASSAVDPESSGKFVKLSDNEYESAYVRVSHKLDRYNAVITFAYKERKQAEDKTYPGADEIFSRMNALEERMERIERENKELRKVNDMILGLFGGMKTAHDVAGEELKAIGGFPDEEMTDDEFTPIFGPSDENLKRVDSSKELSADAPSIFKLAPSEPEAGGRTPEADEKVPASVLSKRHQTDDISPARKSAMINRYML